MFHKTDDPKHGVEDLRNWVEARNFLLELELLYTKMGNPPGLIPVLLG